MTAIGQVIDTLIRDGLASPLEAAGFQRQRRVFRRSIGDLVQVVDVQGSKWNQGARGTITINLGVYSPAAAALRPEYGSPTESPSIGACQLTRRIGCLMPAGEDRWWKIEERTNLRRLGEELASVWTTYGASWFASVPDLAAMAAQLERDGSFNLAASVRLALGELEAATRLVNAAIAHAPQWAEDYRAWARRHGLIAPWSVQLDTS